MIGSGKGATDLDPNFNFDFDTNIRETAPSTAKLVDFRSWREREKGGIAALSSDKLEDEKEEWEVEESHLVSGTAGEIGWISRADAKEGWR